MVCNIVYYSKSLMIIIAKNTWYMMIYDENSVINDL